MPMSRGLRGLSTLFPFLMLFVAGFLAMQVFLHRHELVALTFESYATRQAAMTSATTRPHRYYVLHEPSFSLARATAADPAVLGVDRTPLDGLSSIDIAPGNAKSIEAIRDMADVRYAIRSNIPLFCH